MRSSNSLSRPGIIILLALCLPPLILSVGCGDQDTSPKEDGGPILPEPDTIVSMEGISKPVHVLVDTYGIPHIYGYTDEDTVVIQGYLHARDRFTEIDLIRHVGSGRVAEITGQMPVIGPLVGHLTALTADWLLRSLFTTRRGNRIATEVLERASPELLSTITSFCGGVNAYIRDLREGRNGARLAPYYRDLFGVREDRIPDFTPEDLVNLGVFMGFFLSGLNDLSTELTYGNYFQFVDKDILYDTLRSAPADPTTVLPYPWTMRSPGLMKSCQGPASLLSPLAHYLPNIPREFLPQGKDILSLLFSFIGCRDQMPHPGSNNWVIAPSHTERGYALLANDQHLALLNPAIYYQSHLNSAQFGKGDLNVIGVSFAGFPGVTTGHNEYVAWGQTVMGYDQLDIYKETVIKSKNGFPESVLFQGKAHQTETRWEDFQIGYGPEATTITLPIVYTGHHGPILPYTTRMGTALSARWVGQEPFRDSEGLYLIDRARDVYELADALKNLELAAFHWVFADISGNIGYSGHARIPIRKNAQEYPPYLPLPGTGEAEWEEGFVSEAHIPLVFNPPEGFFNTSNNDAHGTTLDDDPLDDPAYYHFTCDIGFRAHRVRDLITTGSAEGGATFEEVMAWQADTVSLAAVRLLPYLFEAARSLPHVITPRMEEALQRLTSWDFSSPTGVEAFYRKDPPGEQEIAFSVAASIFHAWSNRVLASTFQDEDASFGQEPPDVDMQTRAILFLLEHPEQARTGQRLFDDITTQGYIETPDDILLESLGVTLDMLSQIFGTEDMNEWRWGKIHQTSFLLGYGDFSLPLFPIQGPFPKSGGNFTVDASTFGSGLSSFTNNYGPNTRFIIELEPGKLRAVNAQPGGQSEFPENPHYADLTELWLDNRYHELYFWWDDVLEHRESYIRFEPQTHR